MATKEKQNKIGYVICIQPAANGGKYKSVMSVQFTDVLLAKEYVSLKNYEARTQARLLSIENKKEYPVDREYILVTEARCK